MKKVWYLDVDLTTPQAVREVIERMWMERDLGNDVYVIHMSIANERKFGDPVKNAPLLAHLRENGVEDDELVLLRYSW
jgi:hypothetical protein